MISRFVGRSSGGKKEASLMLVVEVMLALMLFTWGVAIWASFHDEGAVDRRTSEEQHWSSAA
jgi:hypothetical protein